MRKLWILLMMILMLGVAKVGNAGSIDSIVEELKTWQYSIGDYVYLVKEGQSYYGIGVSKDVGVYIDWIGADWLYGDVGYLNTIGMASKDKDWVYGGASLNGGRAVAKGIEWVGEKFGTTIKMPDFLKKNMMKVGYIAATKWDQDEFMKVWDSGVRVRIVQFRFQ